jgi:uncharacterized surface protein with fasciclin (FAS1) repeats
MANLIDTATKAGSFSTLMKAIETAGIADVLRGSDSMTILAPTDEAFAQLPDGKLDDLLQNSSTLRRVLLYHVVPGDMRSDDLAEIDEAPTEEGSVIAVDRTDGQVKVNEATVIQTDILADNGVIHAIDRVLMPAVLAGHT